MKQIAYVLMIILVSILIYVFMVRVINEQKLKENVQTEQTQENHTESE